MNRMDFIKVYLIDPLTYERVEGKRSFWLSIKEVIRLIPFQKRMIAITPGYHNSTFELTESSQIKFLKEMEE